MQVIQLNQNQLRMFGFFLEHDAKLEKYFISYLTNCLILFSYLVTIVISSEYIISHFGVEHETENCLFAALQLVAYLMIFGVYAAFMRNKFEIVDFIKVLQNLVDERLYKSIILIVVQSEVF